MNTDTTVCNTSTCEAPRQDEREPSVARPEYRVEKRDEGISLHIALPGVAKEDVTISVEEDLLKISATRQDPPAGDWKVHQAFARPDQYQLQVRLHRDLDPASISAELVHGVLTLQIERHETAKPRTIEVS